MSLKYEKTDFRLLFLPVSVRFFLFLFFLPVFGCFYEILCVSVSSDCVQNWVAEAEEALFYHMVRRCVVPAVPRGLHAMKKGVAMLLRKQD